MQALTHLLKSSVLEIHITAGRGGELSAALAMAQHSKSVWPLQLLVQQLL